MSARLLVTILGCGSSGGVPRVGNEWGACDPTEPRNRRRRCSVLVERVTATGRTSVLIDTGPDMRQQLLDANVRDLDAVLYTHAHADHLHGIDDLRAFTIRDRKRMAVYMDDTTHVRAEHAFGYCFKTPPGSSYPPILDRHRITAGTKIYIPGAGGAIDFLPVEVNHGDIDALGFVFENMAYLPDVKAIPDSAAAAFEGRELFILDALRRTPHPSHFSLADALAALDRFAPDRAILTNLHNDMDYQTLCRDLPAHVRPAHDGMTIEKPL